MIFAVYLLAILSTYSILASAQELKTPEFVVFGGSIQWHNSSNSVKQFVSQLKIHLYSFPDDKLRQVVRVLPNGAYSVAVSDKGHYRLRLAAPQGWVFHPTGGYEIDLNGDITNNRMNFIFELIGFDVRGHVITAGMTTGPPNLIVTAVSGEKIIAQTRTAADGKFVLSPISPGNYVVIVGDSISVTGPTDGRASTNITVSTTSLNIPTPLILQGHSLRSTVTFAGQGMANIPVLLFVSKLSKLKSSDFDKFGCSKPSKSFAHVIPVNLKDKIVSDVTCQVFTDSEGAFTFPRLAGGEYFLVAYHEPSYTASKIKSKYLEIRPLYISAKMEHVDLQIESGFHISSFRIDDGAVRHASGVPIVHAEVLVDGSPAAKTNPGGTFYLDISEPGMHTIQVRSPGMKFKSISMTLTPSTESLPTFTPVQVEVCGRFDLAGGLKPGNRIPVVEMTSGPAVEPVISSDRKSAEFCVFLAPEKHVLRLAKGSNVVLFSPSFVNIDLSAGSVKSISFTQFLATVTGEVICINTCPIQQLAVRLSSIDEPDKPVVSHFKLDSNNDKRAIFSFKSVIPGAFDIELVVGGKESDAYNGWCFGLPGLRRRVSIIDHDILYAPEVVFKQTGYRMHVEVPFLDTGFGKFIEFEVSPLRKENDTHSTRKPFYFQLNSPFSTLCLPADSAFAFKASAPCLRVGEPYPNRIGPSTASEILISGPPKTIRISISEIPMSVVVEAVSGMSPIVDSHSLPELFVEARVSDSVTKLPISWNKKDEIDVARTSFWAPSGEDVTFSVTPSHPSPNVHLLIWPPKQTLRVSGVPDSLTRFVYDSAEIKSQVIKAQLDETNCDSSLAMVVGGSDHLTAKFSMKLGFMFTGRVEPAVEKVMVDVYADASTISAPTSNTTTVDTDSYAEQQQQEEATVPSGQKLFAQVLTDHRGVFSIGPFYFERRPASGDLSSLLSLRLHKLGFKFTPKPNADWLTFLSQKLALVEILVTSEEDRRPVPSVIISLISNTFREGMTTNVDGVARFIGLPPGEYYIQPTMKEYEFFIRKGTEKTPEPHTEHALSVVEGGSLTVHLVGKRVAFSVFGEVTSLSGHPEMKAVVEARLLSAEEMIALGDVETIPLQNARSASSCRGYLDDFGFVLPVEKALTDANGQFSLLGLFPDCPYLITAIGGSKAQHREVVPRFVVVKPIAGDVRGLHFYLKPRVSMGMISATVDTTDEHLPNLNLVVTAVNQPKVPLIRHKFSTDSRYFTLSGKQLEMFSDNVYTIALETNINQGSGYNSTLQKFNFAFDDQFMGSHHYFTFAYKPTMRV